MMMNVIGLAVAVGVAWTSVASSQTVVVPPPVVVRPKVYVPGQPVRNFFRAFTP